jgi:hypothetical protein
MSFADPFYLTRNFYPAVGYGNVDGIKTNNIPKFHIPTLLWEMGFVYSIEVTIPSDDSWDIETALDHHDQIVHVFDQWTMISHTRIIGTSFTLYFKKDVDLVMAKLILQG